MYRATLKNLQERAKRLGVDLSCYRPGRETICRVVILDKRTGAEGGISDGMTARETDAWLRGFGACKSKADTRERRFIKQRRARGYN